MRSAMIGGFLSALLLLIPTPATAQSAVHCVNIRTVPTTIGSSWVLENSCNRNIWISTCVIGGTLQSVECGARAGQYYTGSTRLHARGGVLDQITLPRTGGRMELAACFDHPNVYPVVRTGSGRQFGCNTP